MSPSRDAYVFCSPLSYSKRDIRVLLAITENPDNRLGHLDSCSDIRSRLSVNLKGGAAGQDSFSVPDNKKKGNHLVFPSFVIHLGRPPPL